MKKLLLLSALLSTLIPALARAEGTAQLGTTQALRPGAELLVDVVDANVERLAWVGAGAVQVFAPSGTLIATLASGQSVAVAAHGNGAYRVLVAQQQNRGAVWDVAVLNPVTAGGRLHSYNWTFDAGSFASSAATNGSFYAIVDGGTSQYRPVIELKLDGLAGYVYDINANRRGVDGVNAGRSVSMFNHSATPEFPIYLSPPAIATYSNANADVFGFAYVGGTSLDVHGNAMAPCQQIAPGASEGLFQFTAAVAGSYHLQCDLNHNGFSDADAGDLLLVGTANPGLNTVSWDGRQQGVAVTPGSYDCRVTLQVGEFHYVGRDIETSYRGMRMYALNGDGSRTPLTMFWDDSLVQASAIAMPNGNKGLVSPGADGMAAGPYTNEPMPDVTARAWGNFVGAGKGDNAFLDTYVWLSRSASTVVTLAAVDPLLDTDQDGASDFAEQCVLGSDKDNPDSDGDGMGDGAQYLGSTSTAQNGGLESNGRLANALADREIRRSHGVRFAALRMASELTPWLQGLALDGLTARAATPDDLTAVSNATDSLGVDFVDANGVRHASVLLIGTVGATYEHSKEVCDRAHGAQLQTVSALPFGNLHVPWAWFRRPGSAATAASSDVAAALKLYQSGNGFSMHAGWLAEQYPAPLPQQHVVNVQVWAATPAKLQTLLQAFVGAAQARGVLQPAYVPSSDDAAWVPPPAVARDHTPATFFAAGTVLGRSLTLRTVRRASTEPLALRAVGTDAHGEQQVVELGAASTAVTASTVLQLPLFADVTVEMYGRHGVVDRLWLSDGAWARFDDGLWGGATTAESHLDCPWRAHHGENLSVLAGCATTQTSVVETQAGVARYLAQPLQLAADDYLLAHVETDRAGRICVEASALQRSTCADLPRAQGWVAWRVSAFDADVLAHASLISFTVGSGAPVQMTVAGLAKGHGDLPGDAIDAAAPVAAGGCRTTPSSTGLGLVIVIGFVGWRRREVM